MKLMRNLDEGGCLRPIDYEEVRGVGGGSWGGEGDQWGFLTHNNCEYCPNLKEALGGGISPQFGLPVYQASPLESPNI
jgi:hypothetical protein